MTCRDIIIGKLKELGADGLMHNKEHHICQCTPDDWSFLCGYDGCINCTPAKLINGKWEAVEIISDNCTGLLPSSPKCQYWNGRACTDEEEYTNNGELCCRYHAEAVKVEDKKEYCEWKVEDDLTGQHYETSCDNAIMFTSGGLRDNGYKYCPYCQLEIREVNHD